MRVSAPLRAIVAAGLLSQSAAQATGYGSPDGSIPGNPSGGTGSTPAGSIPGAGPGSNAPGGVPSSGPAGLPGSNAPGGAPNNYPAGLPGSNAPGGVPSSGPVGLPGSNAPGGVPSSGPAGLPGSNTPGGAPSNYPAGLPGSVPGNSPVGNAPIPAGFPSSVVPAGVPNGGAPGGSSPSTIGGIPSVVPGSVPGGGLPDTSPCTRQSTTTVFITVYPTSVPGSPNGLPPGAPMPGSPDGTPPGGSPDGSLPGGSVPNDSGTIPGGSPNGAGSSSPNGLPGGSSPAGASPNGQDSGGAGPDGSSPDSSANGNLPGGPYPNQSAPKNPHQTLAPAPSAPSAKSTVSPFTTLTIDIWGPSGGGSASGNAPAGGSGPNAGNRPDSEDGSATGPSAQNPAPEYTGSGSSPNNSPGRQSSLVPAGPAATIQSSALQPSQTFGSGNANVPGGQPSQILSGAVQQSSGSLPVTTQGGFQAPGNVGPGSGSPYITITGADGLPTVLPANNAGSSPSFETVIGSDGLPTVYPAGSDTTPRITITGIDGVPTIFPSGNSGSSPFITITGTNGIPTVVSDSGGSQPGLPISSSVNLPQGGGQGPPPGISTALPLPLPSITGIPGSQGPPDGSDAPPGGLPPGSGPSQGVTTCATFTIIGPDGKPTAVDSTWVVAPNTPVIDASAALPITTSASGPLSGIPIDVSGTIPTGGPFAPGPQGPNIPQGPGIPPGSGFPNGPAPAQNGPAGPGVTTCTSWTVTGTDGLPTVVGTTWVVPSASPLNEISTALPDPVITQGPLLPGAPSAGPAGLPSGVPAASNLGGSTTCTTYTYIGPDGRPTVIDTTWVVPGPVNTLSGIPGSPNIPTGASGALPNGIPPAATTQANQSPGSPSPLGPAGAGHPGDSPVTTCTSFTVIGTDGLPTVVDSTWVIPAAVDTQSALPASPIGNSNPAGSAGAGASGNSPITTCTSFTVIGTDGLPTVVDSTWVIPAGLSTPSGVAGSPSLSSGALPGQITNSPGSPNPGASAGAAGVTTCTTFTLIGTDGLPTIVDSTWVVPIGNGLPTGTIQGVPPSFPQASITGAPQSVQPDGSGTVVTTATIIGPDGKPTPIVETVVVGNPTAGPQGTIAGIPAPPPSGPSLPSADPNAGAYGPGSHPPVFSASSVVAMSSADGVFTSGSVTGTVTGTMTSTFTKIVDPTSGPVVSGGVGPLPSYDDKRGNGAPVPGSPELTLWPAASAAYGPVPAPGSGTIVTTTWANVITEQTTSYTINFPLTTMATVTLPAPKRVLRRRQQSSAEASAWTNSSSAASETLTENTSLDASLSALLSTDSTALPTLSITTPGSSTPAGSSTGGSVSATPSICPTGGRIGNTTLDFDSDKPGPLFNPREDIWFSQGFLIAPPSSQQLLPYTPSSGGQLVEFVPPSLSNTTTSGSGDVAQIGVGPNAAKPCFNFNFLGASLGCDAQGNEQWCEFEISAYRYNSTSKNEESIAWSETKHVPACPTFSAGGCQLTHVDFSGYTNITSVLISLRVGLELRVWWGDDIQVGWSDNSCAAATCRAATPTRNVKREAVEWALRKGVWHWGHSGLERLDDEVVWDSLN